MFRTTESICLAQVGERLPLDKSSFEGAEISSNDIWISSFLSVVLSLA